VSGCADSPADSTHTYGVHCQGLAPVRPARIRTGVRRRSRPRHPSEPAGARAHSGPLRRLDFLHPRGLDFLHSRRLDILHPRGLDFLHSRRLDILHPRGLDFLHSRRLDILHPRGLDFLHPRRLDILHSRGLDFLHSRGLHLLHARRLDVRHVRFRQPGEQHRRSNHAEYCGETLPHILPSLSIR